MVLTAEVTSTGIDRSMCERWQQGAIGLRPIVGTRQSNSRNKYIFRSLFDVS